MSPLSPITILFFGFLLGLKHATDADHVVAVTTIVSKQKKLRHAAMIGISWGIGHTFMIIVVGIMIILFHVAIPEKTQLLFEFIVAAALVVLGTLNLTGMTQLLLKRFSGAHTHPHDGDHSHMHVHYEGDSSASHHHNGIGEFVEKFGIVHLVRPLVVGLIHGLAGSAAVALLVLGSISDQTTGVLYLGIFGIGTIVGMMLVTTLLGVPIIAGSQKFSRFDRYATIIAGVISILYGLYFGYQIGVVQGLFL